MFGWMNPTLRMLSAEEGNVLYFTPTSDVFGPGQDIVSGVGEDAGAIAPSCALAQLHQTPATSTARSLSISVRSKTS
jgi:hypothetical protein